MNWKCVKLALFFALVCVSDYTFANDGLQALTVKTGPDGAQEYSVTLQVLMMMTALSFIPAAVIMMTSFTRIIVVLAILRQAIGLQQTPSSQLLVGMALFMSIFIMAPIYGQIDERAIQPYLNSELTSIQALDQAKEPLKAFMLSQTRIKDLETFAKIAGYD